jgi:hypothetical protein
MPVWRGRFAGFKHFFPDSDMLIFFYEPNAGIGEWWNVVEISHISSCGTPNRRFLFELL